MHDIQSYRIHELKKKLKILSSELFKMQSEPALEVEHYEEACKLSLWANEEMESLFPSSNVKYDFIFQSGVLIDDHSIFADSWNEVGLEYGKYVTHYLNGESFLQELHRYPKDIYLYIDWYLGLQTSYELARTLSFEYKFSNIIVTTDDFSLDISNMPWIRAKISKKPPWTMNTSIQD